MLHKEKESQGLILKSKPKANASHSNI
jgi:hypothetical protein